MGEGGLNHPLIAKGIGANHVTGTASVFCMHPALSQPDLFSHVLAR